MYQVGQRVRLNITDELGTVLDVEGPYPGSVNATQLRYLVLWDAGGHAEGSVYHAQLRPA